MKRIATLALLCTGGDSQMNGVRNVDDDWLVLTGNVYQVTGWLFTPQVMLSREAKLEHLWLR